MDKKNLKCPFCGGDLIWGNDFEACDLYDYYSEDDGAIVSNYKCSLCGRNYDVYEPRKDERETTYKDYWEK